MSDRDHQALRSISNSSGPYFHLMLLNALIALALACWLLFSGIDWAPLRSHQRFNAAACKPRPIRAVNLVKFITRSSAHLSPEQLAQSK